MKRYPFWITGAVCSLTGAAGFYYVLVIMKFPEGLGPGPMEFGFPTMFALIGVISLLGAKFAAADTIEVNDSSIRCLVRSKVVKEIPFAEVISVDRLIEDNQMWTEQTGAYYIRWQGGAGLRISGLYGDYNYMRAMLAERLRPQIVPEAWQELYQQLR